MRLLNPASVADVFFAGGLMKTLVAIVLGLLISTLSVRAEEKGVACTSESAIPTRVEDILKDHKPLLGKCVRVTGFVALRGLYDSIQSFYLHE